MADPIDPDKLVSLPQVAKEYGYNPAHLSKLASIGKIKAWHIGNTWITTREYIEEYIQSAPRPGRQKRGTDKSQKQHGRRTEKS